MIEEDVWSVITPDDIWVLDKLILSRKLNYICGPVGTPVPEPGMYIVRPCVNALGLGLGTQKVFIEDSTDHLTPGHFWCEFFWGRHLSVDYYKGEQTLCVEGFRDYDNFTHWHKWEKKQEQVALPKILEPFVEKFDYLNCEFIGGSLIEVHFRENKDFSFNNEVFIPVWQGEGTSPPTGYRYVEYPDIHGRIGAFVK